MSFAIFFILFASMGQAVWAAPMDVSDLTGCLSPNSCHAEDARRLVQKRAKRKQMHAASRKQIEVEPLQLRVGSDESTKYPFGNFWRDVTPWMLGLSEMAYVGERPTSVEYIAVFSSGQQGFSDFKLDHANVVSGTDGSYREEQTHVIDEKSLSGRFFECENGFCFDRNKTLQLSIFDSQFDWDISENEKMKMLKGYEDFLLHQVKGHEEQLKAVYLAGGSRGGCLMARLAQSLLGRVELKHTKFIIQSFDGVCNHYEKEFGTSYSAWHYNPRRKWRWWQPVWYGWVTNIEKQFPSAHKKRLCMRHIVAGEAIGPARPFTACRSSKCAFKEGNQTYYEQEWLTLTHSKMLGHHHFKWGKERIDHSYDELTVVPMIQHFKTCVQMLGIA